MKRFFRIFFAVAAVLLFTGYFFGDLVLTEGQEKMSWDEFSANSGAVASFREKYESAGGNASDLRRAYEQQLARSRTTGLTAAQGQMDEAVTDIKQKWHRVYDLLTPRRGPLARGSARVGNWLVIPSDAIGIAITVAVLIGSVIGLTVLISKLERTAQRVRP